MAYSKTTWKDNEAPYLNASNLNKIETGIDNNDANIESNTNDIEQNATHIADNRTDIDINADNILSLSVGEVYQGTWTPEAGTEYPTAPESGWSYYIQFLDDNGYTFTTGDLTGRIANNSDKMIYNGTTWSMIDNTNEQLGYYIVDDIDSMLGLSPLQGALCEVYGYHEANDGGGGKFNYDASHIGTNNGGTILNGWVRQYSGAVNVKWFGAKGDAVTDDTASIQAAIDSIRYGNNGTVFFPQDRYICNGIQVWRGIALLGAETNAELGYTDFNTYTDTWGRSILQANQACDYIIKINSDAFLATITNMCIIGEKDKIGYADKTVWISDDELAELATAVAMNNVHVIGGINYCLKIEKNIGACRLGYCYIDGSTLENGEPMTLYGIWSEGIDLRVHNSHVSNTRTVGSHFESSVKINNFNTWVHLGVGIEFENSRPVMDNFVSEMCGKECLKFVDCRGGIISNGREIQNHGQTADYNIGAIKIEGDCNGLLFTNLRLTGTDSVWGIWAFRDTDVAGSNVTVENIVLSDEETYTYAAPFDPHSLDYWNIRNVENNIGRLTVSEEERRNLTEYPILEPVTAGVPHEWAAAGGGVATVETPIEGYSSTVRITSDGVTANSGIVYTLPDDTIGKTVRFSVVCRFNDAGVGNAQRIQIQDGIGNTSVFPTTEQNGELRTFAVTRKIAGATVRCQMYASTNVAAVNTMDVVSYKIEVIS